MTYGTTALDRATTSTSRSSERTTRSAKQQRAAAHGGAALHRPQIRYSTESIKCGLGLNDEMYREFYTIIERRIAERGWMGNTFRTISEKETMDKELTNFVATTQDMPARFRETVEHVKTTTGQIALQRLVYKICTNFRRRKRLTLRRNSDRTPAASDTDNSDGVLRTEIESPLLVERSHNIQPPVLPVFADDLWQDMITIYRRDGQFKALCRPCELAHTWLDGSPRGTAGVDDLDFERFVSILESEHAFDRSSDCLGWEDCGMSSHGHCSTIDNARQWKAVIAHMLRRRIGLTFLILPRIEVPEDPNRAR